MIRIAAFLLILVLPAAAADGPDPAGAVPRPVVSIIINSEATSAIAYVGTVVARIEADLGFPFAGTIAERTVSSGDVVSKGTVLARLGPEDFDSALSSAGAGVTVAEAQLRSATDAHNRARELTRRGVASSTQLEDASRALVAAKARLEQAQASEARAKDQLDLTTLTAPQDGVVTATYAEPGTAVSAGQPVLTLAGTDDREIIIDLSEQDVAAYPLGTRFTARLAANPEATTVAILDRIDPVAERTTRTRRLHLTFDNSAPESFRLGALVRVSAFVDMAAGIAVPASAILDGPEGPAVWIIDRKDNRAHLRPSTKGADLGDVSMVSAGLIPGDEVVTRGIHSIEDGQIVGPRVAR